MSDIPPLYCANHPTVETGLRCNNCDKPICPKCAKLTPTGYRCKECLSNHQKVFETAAWYDPLIAALAAVVLSYLGSLLVQYISFFTLFLAPVIGFLITEVVRFLVRRRRSERLNQATTVAAALGGLPLLGLTLINAFAFGFVGSIWSLILYAFYTFIVASTVFYRLRGIRIG